MTSVSRSPAGFDAERIVGRGLFVLVLVLISLPLAFLAYGSFMSDSPAAPGAHFTGAIWYEVYTSPTMLKAFGHTMLLAALSAALSVVIGTSLAWIVGRTNAPGSRVLAPLLVVPLMVSTLVTSLAWIALAAPNAGLINVAARMVFGRPLVDIYSVGGMVMVLSLHYASFAFVAAFAALRSIDASIEEASYVLGAGPFRTALRTTIPLIVPTLVSTFLLIFIFVSENFAVPMVLGGSISFDTLMSQIYNALQSYPTRLNFAAAAGTMLLSTAVVGTLWQRRVLAIANRYVTVSGKGSRRIVLDLGRWRFAATALVLAYLFLSVVIPYASLLLGSFMTFVTPRFSPAVFTLKNYYRLLDWSYLRPAINSFLVAGVGACVAVGIYTLLAHSIRRSGSWLGRVIDYAVMIPTVLPALVLGVGFLWAYVILPVPLYGTIWILFLGYLTRYVGQGTKQAGAALVQVSEDLPEAARVAGASPLRALGTITLPVLGPSLKLILVLIFIKFFMEVSLTVVLYTPQTMTLPILLWSRMGGGYMTEAFAIAVVESTIIFIVLAAANLRVGLLREALD
jgi:iron(III) transport system permease protein